MAAYEAGKHGASVLVVSKDAPQRGGATIMAPGAIAAAGDWAVPGDGPEHALGRHRPRAGPGSASRDWCALVVGGDARAGAGAGADRGHVAAGGGRPHVLSAHRRRPLVRPLPLPGGPHRARDAAHAWSASCGAAAWASLPGIMVLQAAPGRGRRAAGAAGAGPGHLRARVAAGQDRHPGLRRCGQRLRQHLLPHGRDRRRLRARPGCRRHAHGHGVRAVLPPGVLLPALPARLPRRPALPRAPAATAAASASWSATIPNAWSSPPATASPGPCSPRSSEGRGGPHGGVFADMTYQEPGFIERMQPALFHTYRKIGVDPAEGPAGAGAHLPLLHGRRPGDGRLGEHGARPVPGGRGRGRHPRRQPSEPERALAAAGLRGRVRAGRRHGGRGSWRRRRWTRSRPRRRPARRSRCSAARTASVPTSCATGCGRAMWENAGVYRSGAGLTRGRATALDEIEAALWIRRPWPRTHALQRANWWRPSRTASW